MTAKDIEKLLSELKANEKARELFDGAEPPESLEDMAKVIAGIAGKLGVAADAAEILAGLEELDAAEKARTDSAAVALGELSDAELEQVASGTYRSSQCGEGGWQIECLHDFTDSSCTMTDACDWAFRNYFDCATNYHQWCFAAFMAK